MKRLYTVNFDYWLKPETLGGYTRRYILNDDYVENFFDSLRGQLPNMNIYITFIDPVPPQLANHKCGGV